MVEKHKQTASAGITNIVEDGRRTTTPAMAQPSTTLSRPTIGWRVLQKIPLDVGGGDGFSFFLDGDLRLAFHVRTMLAYQIGNRSDKGRVDLDAGSGRI